jgi:hypothetical protein
MNKDIASIIAKYARPKIWKYWFYDAWEYDDTFKRTYIKEASTKEELIQYIYDNHKDIIVKNAKRELSWNYADGQPSDKEYFNLAIGIYSRYLCRYEEITEY